MKAHKLTMILLAVAALMSSCDKKESKVAEAPSYGTTMPGDVERGRALFNDEKLGNGTAGKSCNSCHPAGKGLEAAGEKEEFNIMGKKQKGLAEAVNFCIENALKGRIIFPLGQDMKDIVTYIKSLKK